MKQLLIFCLTFLVFTSFKTVSLQGNQHGPNFEWKNSYSYFKNDNQGHSSSAKPIITITETHIIVRHRIEGGGKITNTTLQGKGGTYTLQEGDNNVNPGEYTHSVIGTVTVYTGGPPSAIYSDIQYK
jgi:hypothetical protein